ncbi:MAG: ABC transporter permease [Schleiferilactobacillus harbinensis]|nr:ABC transporter permease [Schleiferilactobacillus harbinensis]MCI1912189.1 ABC transporter permease [Schleiferilactobacillus harbinensis]
MQPMTKYMWRNIRDSLGRFIAIILIILLGVLIFVGVKATGPALNDSLNTTVKQNKLTDIQLLSTTGFTSKDVATAKKVAGAQAEAVKFKYVNGSKGQVVALYGDQSGQQLNQLTLTSGHRPRHNNEIVLDQRAQRSFGYKLGQTYTFPADAKLARRQFKIVGFADSPLYIDNAQRGSANVGDGAVRYFAYIPASQMKLGAASLLNIRFPSLQKTDTFTDHYTDLVRAKEKQLKKVFKNRAVTRTREVLAPTLKTLDQQQDQLDAAQKQLAAAKQQVASASNGQMTTTPQIAQQETALQTAQKKLTAGRQKAEQSVKTTYTWQTRDDLAGFSAYGDSSERIAAIANVFPAFFFLVAALITFTTVTRMVEEARGQIGAFKALGYGKFQIALSFLNYALLAGVLGTVLGAASGNWSIPRIVIALYKNEYIPLQPTVAFQWGTAALAGGFALLATVGAAIIVVREQLAEKPAALMLPRAPKSAKRILLERIKPLWRRLNFNQKVSYRNLFRYKSRMWMTIIGIAGGTALILTGFGLKNSIEASGSRQYSDIIKYQAVVRLTDDSNGSAAHQVLTKDSRYRSRLAVTADVADISAHGRKQADVNIYASAAPKQLNRYIGLHTNRGAAITLPQKGIVLTDKAAKQLNVAVGDTVTVKTTDNHRGRAKVTAIATNYIGNYAYLSATAYQTLFAEKAVVNTLLVRLRPQTANQRNTLARQLLKNGEALGTSYTVDQKKNVGNMGKMLNPVVMIFILLSGVLSFVVLYNLTNINVSERIRELSTIKVLGFYNQEVTMYISRENIILTGAGILFGYAGGNLLTAYILHQAETAQIIFPLSISWTGYIIATLLMIAFTAIVMFVTHQRLKRVDMVEALKSND